MDEKEAEKIYSTTFLNKKDFEKMVEAIKIKVALRIFRAILDGAQMISTEASVCHHTQAATNALIYLRSTLSEEKALQLDEAISKKVSVFEHFDAKKTKEYQEAIHTLVVAASRKYLQLVSELQDEGSTK